MAWIAIAGTDWLYDNNAYNNLPVSRKEFWDDQTEVTILNGIRTTDDGTEIYMRVKKSSITGDPPYYESELNKTHLESL